MSLRTQRPNRNAKRAGVVLSALLFASAPTFAGELEARVDRDRLQEGESLQLLLRYRGGSPSGAPDLSALEVDFELLDVRQSQRTSIVNGRVDQSFDWIVTLEPRSEGAFEIPALTVGRDASQPLTIRVEDAPTGASAPSAAAFLEVEVDDGAPYVQGKVMLTARLFLDDSVRGGALADPAPSGAMVQRLGEDKSYRTRRDGRELQVIERTYAVFPQESGALEIPPLRFEGTQRSNDRRGRRSMLGGGAFGGRDPFDDLFAGSMMGGSMMGGSLFDDLLGGGGRPIRARSDSIELDVQARPDEAAGAWFLPARAVELIERFEEDPPVFRVGEPVKRTLAIQAVGLSGAQMPELELPEVVGVKQYAGESMDETFRQGDETVAVKLQEVTLIPTRAGRVTLPAIELEWWDVEADERRTASLPAREVDVLDGQGQLVSAPVAPIAPTQAGGPSVDEDGESKRAESSWFSGTRRWYAIAGGAGLLALLGLLMDRRRRRAREPQQVAVIDAIQTEPAPARRSAESALRRACEANDVHASAEALRELGRALYPDSPPASARALAERLESAELRACIEELDRAGFAAEVDAWDGSPLWQAWRAAVREQHSGRKRRRGALPELYPVLR